MSSQPPLAVRNICKSFGALQAVDHVSFSVAEGEIVGFCGPNGAGKTTLFDLLCGLTVADLGQILVDGKPLPLGRPDLRVAHGIARTFQLNAAFGSLSVYDNLLLSQRYGRGGDDNQDIEGLAAEFGFSNALSSPADTISIFQSKMLMLACAIISNPRFVLLDEPVGGLSQEEIEQFREVILRLNRERGTTFLVIEHVMPFLMAVSTRVVFLHEGRVEFDGSPGEFARNRQIVAIYLGEAAASMIVEDA